MTAPLKIDERTDELASHAAHFLGMTKKQYVAEAVAYYTEHRRAEIEKGVIVRPEIDEQLRRLNIIK